MRRALLGVVAVLALFLGLTAAASPASASWWCTGVWPQTPYSANVYGTDYIIGEVRCSGGGEAIEVFAVCVDELIFPWGYEAGGVWINPDGTCTDSTWDAAPADCNHWFRTSAYGSNWFHIGSSNAYWDGCL